MSDQINEIRISPQPLPPIQIGIDTDHKFVSSIIDAAEFHNIDISAIESLAQSAQTREQSYELIDTMTKDSIVSAILETYAEDVIQSNDKGQIVWIESSDRKVLEYVSWLLDSLNVDRNIYKWVYCLLTYGDVYLRLYRKSDEQEESIFNKNKIQNTNNIINDNYFNFENKQSILEDAKIKIYSESDHYIPYVEMVDNPGEMFDLQRFGKTHGYIKAPVQVIQQVNDNLYDYLTHYKMKQQEVEIFDAMSFVHGSIETTSQRAPETADIYIEKSSDENPQMASYKIKRGQSLLYNSFKTWRELNLLEMSALLNRLTKSSVVRILNIDVGDMPKEQVQSFMQRLKEKVEQKSALNVGTGMAEYTNPSPIENTIYVPTHGGQGNISIQSMGGDFDPKSLVDIEYFRDRLFGSAKIPKQYFGFTEDGAGFNGGTSLTIISSRYGKAIKSIQNIVKQMLTDLLNLFLIDRNLDQYVNKFKVMMQIPVTQEEIDRRSNTDVKLRYTADLMNQFSDVKDEVIKFNIQKQLLSGVINDPVIMKYFQEYIDKVSEELNNKDTKATKDETSNTETIPELDLPGGNSADDLNFETSLEI